ncbi:MAG: hypothetical protein ACO3IG_00985 [Opitutales bacterium]
MNSRKDILLVCLGALLFAGGLAIYLNPGWIAPPVPDQEERAIILAKLRQAPPAGAAYPSMPRASLEDNVKDWLSPEEDDENWDYDLFTTIDVVWDPSIKEYVPRSRKAEVMPPFGVELVSVGYPTYTFMLSSSTLAPGKKEEDRLFSLKNVKTNRYIDDCKLNKPIPEAPYLTLKSYRVVKGKDADGFPFVRNVLTVDDRQFGQVVEIDDEKPLEFKGRIDIILRSTDDPAWSLTLHALGDKFALNGATFVVKGIDLPGKSVTFEKTIALNPKRPKKLTFDQQTLVVPTPVPKSKSSAATPKAAAPSNK